MPGRRFDLNNLSVEGDVGYTDWSQLEYKNAADKANNQILQKYYTDALQFRFGGEYVLANLGAVLRAGFKHDPLPTSGNFVVSQIERNRNSFSFGAGFLIDRVVMLDVAYARASYKIYDGKRLLTEDFTSDRVYLSVGYRI